MLVRVGFTRAEAVQTFEGCLIIQQLSEADQTDAAGACRFRLPFLPPFSKYQLLELVDTEIERVVALNLDISLAQVFGIQLKWMSRSRCEQ